MLCIRSLFLSFLVVAVAAALFISFFWLVHWNPQAGSLHSELARKTAGTNTSHKRKLAFDIY